MKKEVVKKYLSGLVAVIVLGSIALNIVLLIRVNKLGEQIKDFSNFKKAQVVLNLTQSELNNTLIKTDASIIKSLDCVLKILE